jgi:hypothetical protein
MDGTLAYVVENNVILEGINRQIDRCGDTVEIRYKTKAKGYELSKQTEEKPGYSLVKIHLDSGETIKTRLLVSGLDISINISKNNTLLENYQIHVRWVYNCQHSFLLTGLFNTDIFLQRFFNSKIRLAP